MKTLKLGFADTFGTAITFFTENLSKKYNVIRDDENPDYLIFGDGNFGQTHTRYNGKCTKVFYTGENVRPDYNQCQYALTFDHENSSRHYRLPLYVLDMWSAVYNEHWTDNYLQITENNRDYERDYDERDFCSFVVSNPRQEMRNKAFHFINEYKEVDSGGPHMNTIGHVIPRDKLSYKLDFLDNYRFNICFENGSYPGYVTEKILNAFQVRTLAIYWGSPTVGRDFNTKSFINAADHGDFNKLVDYVRHLDSPAGKKEYLDIIEQPVFRNDIPNEFTDVNNMLDWWETFVMGGK